MLRLDSAIRRLLVLSPVLKFILWGTGLGVLAYVSLIGFMLFAPKLNSYADQKTFDSQQWQTHLNDRDTIKQKMVTDLLSKHQLVGMTETNVNHLLGKPPQSNYFKDYDYVYWLGPESSAFGIDSEWLGIKFDNGVVIKADLLRD